MKRINFNHIWDAIKKLALLNGLFLLFMTVFRYIFLVYYADLKDFTGKFGYILKAFQVGIRFDMVDVAYINIPVVLSLLIVWAWRSERVFNRWRAALTWYYSAMYALVVTILCVDFAFYSYFQSHINMMIFGIFEDDTRALASTIWKNYPVIPVVLAFCAVLVGIYFFCRYFTRKAGRDVVEGKPWPVAVKTLLVIALVTANGIAARGSLGLFPLGIMDSAVSPDVFINRLSLNGVFALFQTIDFRLNENSLDLVEKYGYAAKPVQAFIDLRGIDPATANTDNLVENLAVTTPENPAAEKLRPNVVLLMMESFGTDLSLYNSPTFNVMGELQRHFDTDYVFKNFLSADIGTIGSFESMLLTIPKRPESTPLSQSRYAFNIYPTGMARPYRTAGYSTIFIYGGNIGWRNCNSYCPLQGFDTVEGEGAMDSSYPRNEWGVFDECLFDHIYKRLSENPGTSKFIFALSTNNHPPYTLPASYKPLPLVVPPEVEQRITGDRALADKRFATYQYANHKLGEFITRLKASPLGRNTVVAVTGDHNFWGIFTYKTEEYLSAQSVPFYLYVPKALAPRMADTTVFGSHTDIMPTLYTLSLSKARYYAVGRDLFDASQPHYAFNANGVILTTGCAMTTGAKDAYYAWDPRHPRLLMPSEKTPEHERLLKHYHAALAATDYMLQHPSSK